MFQLKPFASIGSARLLLTTVILLTAACRPQAAVVQPTAVITLTPLPRSTPLPSLPTAVPVGQGDNPLRLIIHPVNEVSEDTVSDLETAIEDRTDLTVKIELVDSDAEALTALCTSTPEQPVLAWLRGMAYAAANANNCGQPQLRVARGTGSNAATGEASTVIARRGIDALSAIDGRIFCRISSTDLISWLVPSLMMEAVGLSPIEDPQTIRDYETPEEMVKAVSSSACDAAAIVDSSVAERVTDDEAVAARVTTVLTSAEIPYAVLTASSDISLDTLTALNDEFIRLSRDRQLRVQLKELLGQDALQEVTAEDLQPFLEFIESSGQDLTQLGN
ncbi:MAG: PhnD/SsuA/transferrin family substrate-binding protein [Chloroflexi bacterium]|nr:PhnD/SsuA/transferrin family substrate-binding protein [Chloroflexota bacterium]MCC6896974.1 PhnD/SsuA/transferrin family substrate-binding protein [Anaerolineae bacterium]